MRRKTTIELLREEIGRDLQVNPGRIGLERVGKEENGYPKFVYSIHILGDDTRQTLYQRVAEWLDNHSYARVHFWNNVPSLEPLVDLDKNCRLCGTRLHRVETDKGHEMRVTLRCPNHQCEGAKHPRYSIIPKTPPPKMPIKCYGSTTHPKVLEPWQKRLKESVSAHLPKEAYQDSPDFEKLSRELLAKYPTPLTVMKQKGEKYVIVKGRSVGKSTDPLNVIASTLDVGQGLKIEPIRWSSSTATPEIEQSRDAPRSGESSEDTPTEESTVGTAPSPSTSIEERARTKGEELVAFLEELYSNRFVSRSSLFEQITRATARDLQREEDAKLQEANRVGQQMAETFAKYFFGHHKDAKPLGEKG